MKIEYKETKDFTEKEVEQLFLSVNWLSGRYPDRLIKALKGSSLVITAWDGSKLVGLLRGIDDGEMVAFLHYLLVHPDYQGMGIATHLLDMAKEKYKSYFYLNVMPDEKENIPFYERHGFNLLADGAAMQIRHL
ncbi:MAG TPA: GNAT family N-acetyltransferase [Candidatus Bacteroides merdigallinarum]|uniref:GNAT family N-acetyltransferase n=1 Tax=Candidatus Bacteroides merdigallinarum TaxID=2838473 RepID=A0A9D2J1M7_9BACE|nr:GNAT family N-acetyltransferase [Candidatus Bacteroides merdigallinarum]